MTFTQLRYLEAVIRLGSFRKAADELGLAQPSISQQIHALESELGVELLVRSTRGVRLADAGETLLPLIQQALGLDQSIHDRSIRLRQGLHGYVKLGAVNAASSTILSSALVSIYAAHPELKIEVDEADSDDIASRVRDGNLDLGLVGRVPGSPQGIEFETEDLLVSPLVACLPAGHPLARSRTVSVNQLAHERLIVPRSGFILREAIRAIFAGYELQFSYYTSSTESVKRLVAEDVGCAILPLLSLLTSPYLMTGRIVLRSLHGVNMALGLCLVHRPTSERSPAVDFISATLRHEALQFLERHKSEIPCP